MSARLYGRDVGNGSLATLTRGFRSALEEAGLFEGLYALDKSGGSEEDLPPPGALAHHAIFVGNLTALGVMRTGTRHSTHIVQVTPNSNYVPLGLLSQVLELPHPVILSCSDWGTRVIATALTKGLGYEPIAYQTGDAPGYMRGSRAVTVLTARHGVSGDFAPSLESIEQARIDYGQHFRVVHFSTTDGERKGTLELVQAWALARGQLPPHATLQLVLDHHASTAFQSRLLFEAEMELPAGVMLVPRADLTPANMSAFLGQMHVLAAPSRGEGFGLLPPQARACGVPVMATTTTGHSAGHIAGPGVLTIPQPVDPKPIDDGPDALAQPVLPEDIARVLVTAYDQWLTLSEQALAASPAVALEWSWSRQLKPLIDFIR